MSLANMDSFDDIDNYLESNMFLRTEDLESFFDDSIYTQYDSSSPDGSQLASSKNIVSERNRRKKLNDRLYALRSVVPNITKLDKASIIRDAIQHIQKLNDEEKRIQAEIRDLESAGRSSDSSQPFVNFEQEVSPKHKRQRIDNCCFGAKCMSMPSPIEVLELRVSTVGEKTIVVSLTCKKRPDTMVKLCQVFESLKLKVITANITTLPGKLLKTVFLEGDEEEKDLLKTKIETAIEALNNPDSHSPITT